MGLTATMGSSVSLPMYFFFCSSDAPNKIGAAYNEDFGVTQEHTNGLSVLFK